MRRLLCLTSLLLACTGEPIVIDAGGDGGSDAGGDAGRDGGRDAGRDAYVEPWAPPPQCATLGSGDPSTGVRVSGHAFAFTINGGRIEDAYVTALEHETWCVRTGAEGYFELEGVEVGSELTLELRHPDFVTMRIGTHVVPAEGMERLTFQVPDPPLYDLLARTARVRPDPTRCQIAATVTEVGRSLYTTDWPSHGQAGALATITPAPAQSVGPIYFDYLGAGLILPDRDLTETTRDGGVLWLNVTPGEYVLSATADGLTFRSVRVRCDAGTLVNPSPPWSIQAL